MNTSLDHLLEALQYHVPGIGIGVVDHSVLEWLEEIFLEPEARQLFLLQEAHSQLSQSVKGKIADVNVAVAANLKTRY